MAQGGSPIVYEGGTLRVGDIITLRQSKPFDGWLSAEEFLGDCYVKRPVNNIEDSLWEVQVQQQYICSQEYDFAFSESMTRKFDPEEVHMLNDLHEAAENEEYLNKKLMAMKIGKPVVFGDVIQLRHKKSLKLLTVSSSMLAKTERENMRVQITPLGDVNSWLELIPRYKYDHEGQVIPNNAEFLLRVRERSSEFIHGAKKPMGGDDTIREINSSLDSSSWTLGIYQHAVAKTVKDIFCGNLVSLLDIELSSYITLSDNAGPPRDVVASAPTRLSFVATDCNIGTGLLWMIEQKKFYNGGLIEDYMTISLRHFNTGLFLKIDNGAVTAVTDRADASYFEFVVSQSADGSSGMQDGCSIQLKYQSNWLSLHRYGAERKCITTKDKSQAIQLVVSARAFRLFDSDLFMCNECSRRMRIFEKMISMNVLQYNNNSEYIIRSLFSVLEQLDEFLNPDDATVSRAFDRMGLTVPFLTAKQELCVMRQTILREQGGLDAIVSLLSANQENRIPEDIAFDRKHLSILGQVGATDLNRIKPKKRAVEASEASKPVQSTSGKKKFIGAARSISAIQKMKKSTAAPSAVPATISDEDSDSDEGDDSPSMNALIYVSKFVGGLKKLHKKNTSSKKEIEIAASNSRSFHSETSSTKSNDPAPRFLFKHMGKSFKSMMKNPSVKGLRDDSKVEEGDSEHDMVEVQQLQALDERHASLGAYLAHFCLKVLLSALADNRPNQMHLADYVDVVLSQVMENPIAVFCVQTMLTGNLPMLQNKIKEREIKLFLNLVRDHSMNATFIKLLENTCVCPMGIDATQRIISVSLFGDDASLGPSVGSGANPFTTTNSTHKVLLNRARGDRVSISLMKTDRQAVIVSLTTDSRAVQKAVWSESKLYFPQLQDQKATMLGRSVVSSGVPKLYIQWNEIEGYKMYHLFGYHSRVPIETVCGFLRDAQKKKKFPHSSQKGEQPDVKTRKFSVAARRKSSVGALGLRSRKQSTGNVKMKSAATSAVEIMNIKKMEVCEYFIAQLYLAGALCLDRNYVSIRILESHYSYENLLSVLQSKTVVNEIKAPVCSLLNSLYIDREPQVAIKFPRLIRTSVSLGGGDENELNPEPYKFAVLQHIISDFIRTGLDISDCDELSNEMMNLLASLMTFGFYSSSEQLADVITPLLHALEEHRVASVLASAGEATLTAARLSAKHISSKKMDDLGSRSGKSMGSGPSSRSLLLRRDDTDCDSEDDQTKWYTRPVKGLKVVKDFIVSLWGDSDMKKGRRGSLSESVAYARTGDRERRTSLTQNNNQIKRLQESNTDGRRNSLTLFSSGQVGIGATADRRSSVGSTTSMGSAASVQGSNFEIETYILNHMQSNLALFVVLSLVITTTVLSLLVIADTVDFTSLELRIYSIFDLFVSAVFMADLAIRYTCVTRINSDVKIFFFDIFNIIDTVIVAMDVVLLSIGGFGSASFAFTKGLKAVRIVRVSRVVRAARILTRMAKKTVLLDEWVPPARYSQIEPMEANTVTGILRVILLTKQRIQDRQLGSVLRSFVGWYEDGMMGNQRDPMTAYKASIAHDEGESLIPEKKFDDILLDAVMYSDETMVEEALHMLMVHKSQKRLLLEATSKIQIIAKPEVESKYKIIVEKLRFLRNTAETYEIWCALSNQEDKNVAVGMLESLQLLLGYIKVNASTRIVECEAQTYPDIEMQQLFANLDALTTFMMIQEALTAESDSPPEIILDIVRLCNELICWFIMWNPENQQQCFKHLEWFLEKIDFGVNTSSVIKGTLWSNRSLIKEAPKSLISTCAQKIIQFGQMPEYLDVLVGLTHVADTGDSGVLNIRNEIAKVLTNVERSGIFSNWCAAPGTDYYEDRKKAMEPFLDVFPSPEPKELPAELRYHINYIHLLSGCKLGPKLQAIYQIDDIVAAIVDRSTLYNVREALGLLLKQTLEQYAENLDISEAIWRFIEFTLQYVYKMKSELTLKSPKLNNPRFRFETAQWLQFSLEIVSYFFDYFGLSSFSQALAYDTEVYFTQTKRTVPEVQHIINELCLALEDLSSNKLIGPKLKNNIIVAISSVGRHTEEDTALEGQYSKTGSSSAREESTDSRSNFRRTRIMRRGSVTTEIQQAAYRLKFAEYVGCITEACNDEVLYASGIELLEHVPSVNDHVVSDVRFEPLILKMMLHIKSQLKTSVVGRSLERESSETTLWLLKTLRLMIEKSMEYTVKDICDPSFHYGGASARVGYLQDTLNSAGVTELCLDLIAVGIDQRICIQAAELLVCLLARAGGNVSCQTTVHSYLSFTDSTLFFEQVKEMIEQQVIWCQRDAESQSTSGSDGNCVLPDQIVIMKLIQLLCEGNYQANKNMMREQEGNVRFVNILGSIVEYIKLLSRMESLGCTLAAVRVINTIVFLIQGPCIGNQEYFVLHSDLLAALNRLLRSTRPAMETSQRWGIYMELLKENIIDTLRACIEAQRHGSAVMERVESVAEVNVLNVLILSTDAAEETRYELTPLQAKYLAFLPTLSPVQDFPIHVKRRIDEYIANIEVIWGEEIHHIFFDVPPITQGISSARKEKLLTAVEGANQDEKLKDFMKRASGMYIEVVHTEWLQKVGMHGVLLWENRVAWMLFWNALVINCIFVRYFVVDQQRDEIEDLPDQIQLVVYILSVVQALMCCLTLFFLITIKLPVRYKIARLENKTKIKAVYMALTEPLLLWYSVHLLIVFLSFYYFHHLILSLLLLDFIVLDSTNKTILYAVYIPARLLITNIIVTLILLQIGACIVFIWYRDQYINFDVESMWDSFRIAVGYGLRAVEGLGQIMNEVTDDRAFFDVIMFFAVVVLLRNIFFGIIIDTFGELRDTKAEKEADAANRCFICGIDRFEYDKRVPHGSINFMLHRESVHNMWNYLYFAIKIWKQPRDQDSGIEVHVRKCISQGDVSWMPIGRIGVLEQDAEGFVAEGKLKTSSDAVSTAPRRGPSNSGHDGKNDDDHGGGDPSGSYDLDVQFGLITEKLAALASQSDIAYCPSGSAAMHIPEQAEEARSQFSSQETVSIGPGTTMQGGLPVTQFPSIENRKVFSTTHSANASHNVQVQEEVRNELAEVHLYVQKLKVMLASISSEVARMERNTAYTAMARDGPPPRAAAVAGPSPYVTKQNSKLGSFTSIPERGSSEESGGEDRGSSEADASPRDPRNNRRGLSYITTNNPSPSIPSTLENSKDYDSFQQIPDISASYDVEHYASDSIRIDKSKSVSASVNSPLARTNTSTSPLSVTAQKGNKNAKLPPISLQSFSDNP